MIIVLIIAAIVSLGISFLQHDADFVDPIIILAIVVFNALLGTLQESKAEKALEALEKMTSPHAKVLRDGKMQTILSEDLVVGDVLFLEAGDAVSADARLVSATGLKVDESSITGESVSVDKDAGALCPAAAPLGDRHNMVFASTVITQGRGKALVTATGMDTQVGQIAGIILDTQSQQTPLQKKLGDVGKVLGIGALCICGLIFVIGIFRGISVFEMFMTAVSLAVAAIPEGLPAIVTIMLALGVTRIAKKNAIIRKLPAVETLGSASVICSDKTGTLTQNKMTVTAFYGDKKQLLTLVRLMQQLGLRPGRHFGRANRNRAGGGRAKRGAGKK